MGSHNGGGNIIVGGRTAQVCFFSLLGACRGVSIRCSMPPVFGRKDKVLNTFKMDVLWEPGTTAIIAPIRFLPAPTFNNGNCSENLPSVH